MYDEETTTGVSPSILSRRTPILQTAEIDILRSGTRHRRTTRSHVACKYNFLGKITRSHTANLKLLSDFYKCLKYLLLVRASIDGILLTCRLLPLGLPPCPPRSLRPLQPARARRWTCSTRAAAPAGCAAAPPSSRTRGRSSPYP